MKKFNKKQLLINMLLFVFLPFLINIIIESFERKAFLGGIEKLISQPYIFFCNTLIIAFTISIGLLLGRYRYFWVSLISTAWIVLGLANFLLLSNRVLPLTANDLKLIELLSSVINKYLNPLTLTLVSFLCVAIILGVFILFFRTPKPKEKGSIKNPIIAFLIITILTFSNLGFSTSRGILETRFPELPKSYLKNGFAYSFAVSLIDSGVNKVDGYSEDLIKSITEKFEENDKTKVKTPNVIFLQLESFFDLNKLSCVKFDKNPLPNFTRLMEEGGSGLFTVPIIGAGTVNTEFEVVTGMRVMDFGAGEYPYKTILTDHTCESIAYNLKNHGYVSHFMHNYRGTFYGRNRVYANLGYDYFYSLEYMTGYEMTPNGWSKDEILTRYINESLDSTEGPDLITAISVQGHGGYTDISDYEKHLTVTECNDSSKRDAFEYYANQIYEMDQFIGELVSSLSERDEEVILVAYGDHLPSLDLQNSDLVGRNVYQTDYFIWNNMGINYSDEDLQAYQINSRVLESINIKDGVINSCHQTYKDDKQYSYNLQALEYDILYGAKHAYDGNNPYNVSQMKRNSRKIKISELIKKEDAENVYILKGEGFTQNSFVRVDFNIVSTHYIDENTLEFKTRDADFKEITVWEKDIGNSNKLLAQ